MERCNRHAREAIERDSKAGLTVSGSTLSSRWRGPKGQKHLLGLREGATENATVVTELLASVYTAL